MSDAVYFSEPDPPEKFPDNFVEYLDDMMFSMTKDFSLMLYGRKPTVHEVMSIHGPKPTSRKRLSKRERRWVREKSHRRKRRHWRRGPWGREAQMLIDWAAGDEDAMSGEIVGCLAEVGS